MDKKYYENLAVSSAPHIVTAVDTRKTMQMVFAALVPALAVSTYVFGARVLVMTAICICASVLFEMVYQKALKKDETWNDFSAVVTGTLIAFNVPSNFPFWMAILGCFVAIIIVKQLYGGLGRNFANPAIVARIVLLLSFTARMTTWPVAMDRSFVDAATGATPLAILAETPVSELGSANLPSLGQLLIGTVGGSMGEVSAIAILIGGLFLMWKKIISPATPLAFIGTVFVVAFIYYSVAPTGDVSALYMACFHVLAGGVMLGAFFMATDYVTSPIMPLGKVIAGIFCGFFTMVIRLWAGYPEGVSFSILLMNICTPLIDMLCERLAYGGGAKKNEK